MHRMLGISRYFAKTAIALRKTSGYGACPSQKIGRSLSRDVVEKVKKFYDSDKISRVMPGKKDCISINKISVQKRLLLGNLKDVYDKFVLEYPDTKISISKFMKLRPAYCAFVGCSGSHNVCVCKTHQNMNLKIKGLNRALKTGNSYDIDEMMKKIMCTTPNQCCYLLHCDQCPGFSSISKNLEDSFKADNVVEIHFKTWSCTDR